MKTISTYRPEKYNIIIKAAEFRATVFLKQPYYDTG